MVSTYSKFEEIGLKKIVFAPIFEEKKIRMIKNLALILLKNTNRTIQQPYPILRDNINYTTVNNFNIFN